METTPKRSIGRPRTRPEGADAAKLGIPVSVVERTAINAAAASEGMSTAQWMRKVVLSAAEILVYETRQVTPPVEPVVVDLDHSIELVAPLVFEVRRQGDRLRDMMRRVDRHLDCGVKVVVMLEAEIKAARVFRKDSDLDLTSQDVLTLPDILPGFSVPVGKFFE